MDRGSNSGSVMESLLVEEKTNGEHCIGPNSDIGGKSSSVTAVVVFSTLVVVCGFVTYGHILGYSSPAESGLMDDQDLSVAGVGTNICFRFFLTVGGIVRAFIGGRIADLIGRRGTMWLAQIFCIMGWLAIVFTKTIQQLMLCCGLSLSFYIGTIITWPVLALIGTVPCLLQLLGLFFIPESPRWLVKLEAALWRLRGENDDIFQEAADIWVMFRLHIYVHEKDFTEAFQHHSEARILDLFQRRYAYSLTVSLQY
ncbi:hypothetical protein VitviT2T_021101 [Vitis vinifera]|uniref:Major facilitator superfamily (MFS) profile domain-containing protein n=1 Tax=Vitis vinifera TaxID=29760 RepID=A0ABY9D824_VITVI|nr:hypothetical protein VitviT2T_021101 [Vitis vinifera]